MTNHIHVQLKLTCVHVHNYRQLKTGLSIRAWTELLLTELACPGRGDPHSWIPAWRVANTPGDPTVAAFPANFARSTIMAMDPSLDLSFAEQLSLVWYWGAAKDGLIPGPQAARLARLCAWIAGESIYPQPERGVLVSPHALYTPPEYDVETLPWRVAPTPGARKARPPRPPRPKVNMDPNWTAEQLRIHRMFCPGCKLKPCRVASREGRK